jgi:uncharacterized protein (DUF1697 family)
MATFIALLRGINVSGRNKIPMPELRALCADLGWRDVQSYIQSGNLLFQAASPAAKLETQLEDGIKRHFALAIPVIIRPAAKWSAYAAGNPYPGASAREPNLVMLALSKTAPITGAVEQLRERASAGERVTQVGDALWIHFAGGSARSKLSPALLDRLAGSPVTTRNWRTVLKLRDLAGGK